MHYFSIVTVLLRSDVINVSNKISYLALPTFNQQVSYNNTLGNFRTILLGGCPTMGVLCMPFAPSAKLQKPRITYLTGIKL